MLRVQAHRSCPRHHLIYEHWTWQLRDGSEVHDRGVNPDKSLEYVKTQYGLVDPTSAQAIFPTIPLSPKLDASHQASTDIFCWFLANHEGKPPEATYDDEWIAECFDYTDEAHSDVESDADSYVISQV